MNVLKQRRMELLDKLDKLRGECNYNLINKGENEKHFKKCKTCRAYKKVGKEYEKIQAELKSQRDNSKLREEVFKEERRDDCRWSYIAYKNGVSSSMFRIRLSAGMSYERAAQNNQREASQ